LPLPVPGKFSVVVALEHRFREIRDELDRLPADAFVPWPVLGAYSAGWSVFPIHLRSQPDSLIVDFAANRRACPRLASFVRDNPRVVTAAFSRINPGCHIYRHTDLPVPGVIRSHLAVDVPGLAKLRVRDEIHEWSEGSGIVFDGCLEHEVANFGPAPRTVLLVDFRLTDEERDEVARVAPIETPTWCEPAVCP